MVSKVLFWSGFGFVARWWQMGIEMRPFFNKESLWVYPIYMTGGGLFGYWLQGVQDRQQAQLSVRKESLLQKRARKAARDAENAGAEAEAEA